MKIEMSDHKSRSFEFRVFSQDLDTEGNELGGRPDEDGLLVSGRIECLDARTAALAFTTDGIMVYPCARCLEPTPTPCHYFFEEAVEFEPDSDAIDLIPYVEECLFINEPFKVLCDESCKGLCPGCGVNLNREACRCTQEETIDPRMAALQQLLERKD